MMTRDRLALGLLVAVMVIGCATALPPAQPARDLKSITGKWEGSVLDARGQPQFHSTLTIRPDGTYENLIPALSAPGPRFLGVVTVVDGQFRWKNETSGLTGVYTLHEGDGKRVLTSDGGGTVGSGRWEPAK